MIPNTNNNTLPNQQKSQPLIPNPITHQTKPKHPNLATPRSHKQGMEHPLPRGHVGQARAVLVDGVPVELAAARVQVDLVGAQPAGALPEEAADPEDDDDGEGEVRLEEALHVVVAASDGADGDVELWGVG